MKKFVKGGIDLSVRRERRKYYLYLIVLFPAFLLLSGQALSFMVLPPHQNIVAGEEIKPELPVPGAVLNNISFHLDPNNNTQAQVSLKESFSPGETIPVVKNSGKIKMQVKLFGIIPINEMVVNVLPRVEVIPGGQSIGVLMHANGVLVIGKADINIPGDNSINPASKAGIEIGDVILQANGQNIKRDTGLKDIINKCGEEDKKIKLKIKRNDKIIYKELTPVYSEETGNYRIGLFVRDTAAGVGTLTFYHPESGTYGALGHMVSDNTSNQADLDDGCIMGTKIQGINPGKKGQPGQKIGLFEENSHINGNITKNTKYGIFGQLETPLTNPVFKEPLPVALNEEIEKGSAKILTVVNESHVKKYDIEIEQVMSKSRSDGKGLIIKITDEELLNNTGGIIQGMSGSPIIQDEKIIGAVTHVFVNNPRKGYGVLAQWMLQEAGIYHQDNVYQNVS